MTRRTGFCFITTMTALGPCIFFVSSLSCTEARLSPLMQFNVYNMGALQSLRTNLPVLTVDVAQASPVKKPFCSSI